MSNYAMFWTGVIGAAATIPFVRTVAIAATGQEIGAIAKSITVQISEPGSVGSGVILQRQGDVYTVLTNEHVVRAKGVPYTIATSDGKKYRAIAASIRLPSVDVDLAVIKFRSSANYATAKLGNCNSVSEGMDLYVSGYPAPTAAITKSVFLLKKGTVSANSTLVLARGYSLIYDNQTLAGMSGGAVLNQNGELIAIHGRGDRDRDPDGQLSEKNGNNLGIPINRFAEIANSLGVDLDGKVAPIPQTTVLKAADYFALATEKVEKGDHRGAVAAYDRAIQLDPNYAEAYNKRGDVKAVNLNDLQGGMTDYDRAIQLKPNYARAYNSRGVLKALKLNDRRGALSDYDRAIQLDPSYSLPYNNRGFLKAFNLNDVRGGLADFDRAIQIDPTYVLAYNNRGALKYSLINDVQGGLADYTKAIQIKPNYAEAYNNRALLRVLKLKDFQGALSDYNRAIQLLPNYDGAYYNRGSLKYFNLKDIQGGLADYNRAIQINNNARAYYDRGVLKHDSLNDIQGGIADMKQAAKLLKQQNDISSYKIAIDKLKEWGISNAGSEF